MSADSLLDQLRLRTTVDCDTLEEGVAKSLGPFIDCTSNQVIALNELKKPLHANHVRDAGKLAAELQGQYPDIDDAELAVEIAVSLYYSSVRDMLK